MRIYRPLLYLFIMIVLFGQTGCQTLYGNKDIKGKQHTSDSSSHIVKKVSIQARIKDYLRFQKINGSVAIVKNNKVIFNQGMGYTDFQKGVLNHSDTTYPIGSITKTVVATSIMQLQEKGKLSIQDPISKYLPDFPNGSNIKLVHLLTHTSGIYSPLSRLKAKTPAGLIKQIEKSPIKFAAGTKWDYRDENYVILGYILEKVTGESLHKYIQKNIFAKAGMKHSGFITKKDPDPFTSMGYLKGQLLTLSSKKIHHTTLFGYGDIYSTAHDISLYDMALMNGNLVSKKSLNDILTPGSQSNYGLGLYNLGYAVYSRGVVGGWEALHVYYKDKTSIVLLLNVRDKSVDIRQISKGIFQILDEETPNPRFREVGIRSVISKACWL